MKNKICVTLFIFLIILFIMVINIDDVNISKKANKSITHTGKNYIECLYYNPVDFIQIKEFEIKETGIIHGCIVPHHLVAKDLIHETFQNIIRCKNKYETVILFGPDHQSMDKGKIFTTLRDYQTPYGILNTNNQLTSKLINEGLIVENNEKMTIEHSTSTIVPFIKYYLGDVDVVTFALTKQTKLEQVNKLIDEIYKNIDIENTLFIASVDFSHYLTLDEANTMDTISMDKIENRQIDDIMKFTNDNLDSPISIVTMLKLMEKGKANNIYRLNHSNQNLILTIKSNQTTSYITYLFY
ncbi:AmmeMemoRadiSam system protein B [Sedimentibacter sp. zth1]|uniref:AmmeMemoRadiSam system protein B n=1 Tax=Sedimentibacter sp. zth1 TaxID=2816908 RepID=UPI001A93286C|nr:AmmeMemoRadiSam system protein B [Sedimentibacter sp. zth1]QSX05748.1 AmmeMemoRadiSam system protein B [Sedimentibacter sp. zth1]